MSGGTFKPYSAEFFLVGLHEAHSAEFIQELWCVVLGYWIPIVESEHVS